MADISEVSATNMQVPLGCHSLMADISEVSATNMQVPLGCHSLMADFSEVSATNMPVPLGCPWLSTGPLAVHGKAPRRACGIVHE